jgi:hypothetical protein
MSEYVHSRQARPIRRNLIEAHPRSSLINESIDRPNRIVPIAPVFQVFRKQLRLLEIDLLDETPHPIPRTSPESLPRESHEAERFHTVRVGNGISGGRAGSGLGFR